MPTARYLDAAKAEAQIVYDNGQTTCGPSGKVAELAGSLGISIADYVAPMKERNVKQADLIGLLVSKTPITQADIDAIKK